MYGLKARERTTLEWALLAALLLVPLAISLAAFWGFNREFARVSLFALSNLVGPTAESVLHGGGLTVCTEMMGTLGNPICFHGGRMPLPSLVVALGVKLLGNHFLFVAMFKLLLLLLPLQLALVVVWRQMPGAPARAVTMTLLLLVPFGTTALLADVVNLQVEEGYTYGFIALALALLFFVVGTYKSLWWSFGFAVCVDALYLAKSAMIVAGAVLVVSYCLLERRFQARVLVLLLALAAPVGWAAYQHHASGRYSIGTSIDGMNLHKGNNAQFLQRYPPRAGDSLDRYDQELNRGMQFGNEWSFNDFHQRAAVAYVETNPANTARASVQKLAVVFVTVHKLGSSESHGIRLLVETAGLAVFRVLLWIAIGLSVAGILRRRTWAAQGAVYLTLVAACALPYVLGFAYIRHVSILIYPTVLMCCVVLASEGHGDPSLGARS